MRLVTATVLGIAAAAVISGLTVTAVMANASGAELPEGITYRGAVCDNNHIRDYPNYSSTMIQAATVTEVCADDLAGLNQGSQDATNYCAAADFFAEKLDPQLNCIFDAVAADLARGYIEHTDAEVAYHWMRQYVEASSMLDRVKQDQIDQ